MKPSEALAKHGSDKVIDHHYGDFYDEMFGQFKEPMNILEIGVLRGQSLLAWRECFPESRITGIDIVNKLFPPVLEINFIHADIKKVKLVDKYHVIIDDSSHDLQESTYEVKNFCENLTDDGVFVIEDVQIPDLYMVEIGKVLPEGFKMEHFDFRHITNGRKHDDFIIKITRS